MNDIAIGKMNERLLARALEGLGARGIQLRNGEAWFMLDGVRCQLTNGRLVVPQGYEHMADRLKVAYSREVVKYTAKRNGWQIKETRPNVFAVVK